MENASKALIIAGAIILGILIIGLGMAVFNQAKDAITGSNMDAEKLAAINSKFESYCGTAVKGSTVRNLCDVIKNNNLTADDSTTYKVKLTYGTNANKTEAPDIITIKNSISASKSYKVTATYDTSKGGVISLITIAD